MFDTHVELKYKEDNTFRQVVDSMRAILSAYHITSGELRQAAVLAATMHEMENIKPLYYIPGKPGAVDGTWVNNFQDAYWASYPALSSYPALFGGTPKAEHTVYPAGCIETSTPESRATELLELGHYFVNFDGNTFDHCAYCSLSETYARHFKVKCEGIPF
jgi:hypothetical protein